MRTHPMIEAFVDAAAARGMAATVSLTRMNVTVGSEPEATLVSCQVAETDDGRLGYVGHVMYTHPIAFTEDLDAFFAAAEKIFDDIVEE